MKQPFLICILAILTFVYFYNPGSKRPAPAKTAAGGPASPPVVHTVSTSGPVVASAPSSYDRWKTGPTAQSDWKSGPNAQTNFDPFAPSEHATWNQNPGYSIIAGARVR